MARNTTTKANAVTSQWRTSASHCSRPPWSIRSCHRAGHAKGRDGVEGELAVQERHRGQRAEQQRPPPHHPEHADPEKRLRVAALRLDQVRRQHDRRQREREHDHRRGPRRDRRASRTSSHQRSSAAATLNSTIVRCSAKTVGPRTRNTGAMAHASTAEHVLLPVEEQRPGPALRQVLGHQTDDGLIRVEVGLVPRQEEPRTKHDCRDEGGDGQTRSTAATDGCGRPIEPVATMLGGHSWTVTIQSSKSKVQTSHPPAPDRTYRHTVPRTNDVEGPLALAGRSPGW